MFIPQWEKPERTKFIMLVWSSDAAGMAPSNPGLEKSISLGQNRKPSYIWGGKKRSFISCPCCAKGLSHGLCLRGPGQHDCRHWELGPGSPSQIQAGLWEPRTMHWPWKGIYMLIVFIFFIAGLPKGLHGMRWWVTNGPSSMGTLHRGGCRDFLLLSHLMDVTVRAGGCFRQAPHP